MNTINNEGSEIYGSLFFDAELLADKADLDIEPYRMVIQRFMNISARGYISISSKYLFFYLLRHMMKRGLMSSFYLDDQDIIQGSGLSVNMLIFSRDELTKLGVISFSPSCDAVCVKAMYKILGL